MDNVSEFESQEFKEKLAHLQHRQLNERFNPFDPTTSNKIDSRRGGLRNEFLLSVDKGIPEMPISVRTFVSNERIVHSTAPFSPKEGYQIDSDDFDLETRKPKIKGLKSLSSVKLLETAPLNFEISANEFDLIRLGISEERRYVTRIKPEFLTILERLRVQLYIPQSPQDIDMENPEYHPSSSFEAKPSLIFMQTGSLYFGDFYPLDTGPLAIEEGKPDGDAVTGLVYREGLIIKLPKDPQKLKQIELKFILEPVKDGQDNTQAVKEPSTPKPPTHKIW